MLSAPPACSANSTSAAAVPWRAQTKLTDGGTEDLAGVSLLRFDTDGLVVEERDYCHDG